MRHTKFCFATSSKNRASFFPLRKNTSPVTIRLEVLLFPEMPLIFLRHDLWTYLENLIFNSLQTELREKESHVVVLLCFKTCSFFVIIFRERTIIFISVCDQHVLPQLFSS